MAGSRTVLSRTRLFLAVVIGFLALAGCKGNHPWTGWYTPGDTVDNVNYHPDQPIAFNHKLHAGDMKIDCQYCHSAARRSAVAGIPPVNTCMGCHKFAMTDKPEVQKIAKAFESNEPIVWNKVHDLPDFVRFTHERHVAKGLDCKECHGDVASMGTAKQVAPLQMGWCIDCHVKNDAPTACFTCHY